MPPVCVQTSTVGGGCAPGAQIALFVREPPFVSSQSSTPAWKQDFLASIVVFFVALPLCMGVALASGAPVAAGLITGIVGGIVAGSLAGCPLQVSGPAAGLTVIVYECIQRLGFENLGLAVLVAGAAQILACMFRLGQWFRAVSPAVINGMLAGIGVLIFASQFHVMVDDKPRGSGLENLTTIPQAVWKGIGIPRLPSEEERHFRRSALQAAGDAHHRQTSLRTQIAELIPYHHAAGKAPALDAVIEPGLVDLAQSQADVSQWISDIEASLTATVQQESGENRLSAAQTALAEARQASDAAEAALQSGKAVDAVRTQEAAVASLENALSRLKSHRLAAGLGILTIGLIIGWQKLSPKKLRLAPAPLIGILAATALAAAYQLPVLYVEIPGNLFEEIHIPTWPVLKNAPWADIVKSGLIIAIVASAETLLSATAVTQLQRGTRTNYDRELGAQGAGNVVCGLLGVLPMTGVIVRSSANVQAGAKSRLSAVLHGLWLLIFVALLGGLLQMIPTASLAAVLVYTGYKLVNVKQIKKLLQFGWGEVAIYAATLTTIVVEDLLTGVILGMTLAAAKLLYAFSHLSVRVAHDRRQGRYVMHLTGAATFVRLPQLAAALEETPPDAELHVDLGRLTYIDHACMDLFTAWAQQHAATGGQLVIDWDTLHASFQKARPEPPEESEAA
jgi:MFS superfamily sulfate permease-like transporter